MGGCRITPTTSLELIVCGWDEVFILRIDSSRRKASEKVWRWRADEQDDVPEAVKAQFGRTDECKPVDGGRRILITSSLNGVALVDRASKEARFLASVENAHSGDLLPGDRIAVASSLGDAGNRLLVFDLAAPEEPIWQDPLPGAHGALWDGDRRTLWALGHDEIRAYHVEDPCAPTFRPEHVRVFELPDPDGHDLSPVPGTALLAVTTRDHVWLFDRDAHRFRLHPDLADESHVKCVSTHPATGQVAWVRDEHDHWWGHRIRFAGPAWELDMADERLYKVRWRTAGFQPAL